MEKRSRACLRPIVARPFPSIVVACVVLVSCASALEGSAPDSVKSRTAKAGEVPQVVVIYERKTQALCSGSVFGQVFVVTSSRCFKKADGIYDVYNAPQLFTDPQGKVGATVPAPTHTIIDIRRASPLATTGGQAPVAGDGDIAVAIVDHPFARAESYSLDLLDPTMQGLASWPALNRVKADFAGYGQSVAHRDAGGQLVDDGAGVKRIGTTLVLDYGRGKRVFSSDAQPSVGCLGDGGGPLLYNVMSEDGANVRLSFLPGILFSRTNAQRSAVGQTDGAGEMPPKVIVSSVAEPADVARFGRAGEVRAPSRTRLASGATGRSQPPLTGPKSENETQAGAQSPARVTGLATLKNQVLDCEASGVGNQWTATEPYVEPFLKPQMRDLALRHLANAEEFWKDFLTPETMRRTLKRAPVEPLPKANDPQAQAVERPVRGPTQIAAQAAPSPKSSTVKRPGVPWTVETVPEEDDGPNPLPPALEPEGDAASENPLPPALPARSSRWRRASPPSPEAKAAAPR